MKEEEMKIYIDKLLTANLKQHNEICALNYKLNYAKVLIKEIIRVTWGEGWNYSLDKKLLAQEFLDGKKPELPEELTMEWRELNENTAVSGPID